MSYSLSVINNTFVTYQPKFAKSMERLITVSLVVDSVATFAATVFSKISYLQTFADRFSFSVDILSLGDIVNSFVSLRKWYLDPNKKWSSSVSTICGIGRHTLLSINTLGVDFGTIASSVGNIPVFGLAIAGTRVIGCSHAFWDAWNQKNELEVEISQAQQRQNVTEVQSLLKKKSIVQNKMFVSLNHIFWGAIRLIALCTGATLFSPAVAALGSVYLTTYGCFAYFSKDG